MEKIIMLGFILLCLAGKGQDVKLNLSSDSGYIQKKEGLPFLLSKSLTDTADRTWDLIKETDTIGKYYKVKQSSNFFLCMIDYSARNTFETHLLIELKPNKEIVKSERFFHGNYSCCWNNYYEGFNKTGDYFSLKTCGTGAGYCAAYLYVFKEIMPQGQQESIPQDYWFSHGEQAQSLSSEMEMKDDRLIMHYKLEDGMLDDNFNFNVKSVMNFDATFYLKEKKWVTPDSAKFNGLVK